MEEEKINEIKIEIENLRKEIKNNKQPNQIQVGEIIVTGIDSLKNVCETANNLVKNKEVIKYLNSEPYQRRKLNSIVGVG